jgi:hypothetical protein
VSAAETGPNMGPVFKKFELVNMEHRTRKMEKVAPFYFLMRTDLDFSSPQQAYA